MTMKHDRFKLQLESIIVGLSFPRMVETAVEILNEVNVRESITIIPKTHFLTTSSTGIYINLNVPKSYSTKRILFTPSPALL
jgi:hypothetical protein